MKSLSGKTVAILVADGFEQEEMTEPGARSTVRAPRRRSSRRPDAR